MGTNHPTGYSASVRLWLSTAGRMVPLSHASSNFVIAKEPVDLPAGTGHVVLSVDGTRYERPVIVVNGMSRANREAAVTGYDDIPI